MRWLNPNTICQIINSEMFLDLVNLLNVSQKNGYSLSDLSDSIKGNKAILFMKNSYDKFLIDGFPHELIEDGILNVEQLHTYRDEKDIEVMNCYLAFVKKYMI